MAKSWGYMTWQQAHQLSHSSGAGVTTAGFAPGAERDGNRALAGTAPGRSNAQTQTLPAVSHSPCLRPGKLQRRELRLRIWSRAGRKGEPSLWPCPSEASKIPVSSAQRQHGRKDCSERPRHPLNIHNCVIRGCQCIALQTKPVPLTCPGCGKGFLWQPGAGGVLGLPDSVRTADLNSFFGSSNARASPAAEPQDLSSRYTGLGVWEGNPARHRDATSGSYKAVH